MKREKSDRFPIPESLPERFMGVIYSMLEPFNMDKVPEVMHYIELLSQAVDRHMFNKAHPEQANRKENEGRRRFIAIFKQRYLHHTDMEYSRPVVPEEGRNIVLTTKLIEEKGFTTDEFLEWVFDVFFEENPKFNPPSIKFVCSRFVVEKFLFENREVMKQKKEDQARRDEALKVIGRGRIVIRTLRDSGRKDEMEKMLDVFRRYRDRDIMMSELRAYIDKAEKELQPVGVTGNGNEP